MQMLRRFASIIAVAGFSLPGFAQQQINSGTFVGRITDVSDRPVEEAGLEVTRVYLQIEGSLRSTYSRKVAQALHKGKCGLASVGELHVDDLKLGLASFTPKPGVLDLRRIDQELMRAGYGLKMVMLETTDADAPVTGRQTIAVAGGCYYTVPAPWKRSDSAQVHRWVWVPSGKESTRKPGVALPVDPRPISWQGSDNSIKSALLSDRELTRVALVY